MRGAEDGQPRHVDYPLRVQSKLIGMHMVALGLLLTGCQSSTDDELGEAQRVAELVPPDSLPCRLRDQWEPNPVAAEASAVPWQDIGVDSVLNGDIPAYLCPGEDDWYYLETADLDYEDPYLLLFAEINDSPRCAAACGNPPVTPGPKYAMNVEVYRADTMELLDTGMSNNGEVLLGGPGDLLHDVVIHVNSPTPSAQFVYSLWVLINDGPYGDDCEC